MDGIDLASTTGIAVATMTLVEMLKKSPICQSKFLVSVPVYVYTVIIAAVIGLAANKVLTDDQGNVLMPGQTWHVIWQCVLAAANASGVYTWLRNPEKMKTASSLSEKPDAKTVPIVPSPVIGSWLQPYAEIPAHPNSGGDGSVHKDDSSGTQGVDPTVDHSKSV